MASPNQQVLIQVKGEDPISAPPALFSNFLGITRVGMDVQFEFVFLDLNQVVKILHDGQQGQSTDPLPVTTGQTVAKIIMPAAVFAQLKEHIARMIADIEKNLAQLEEAKNATTDDNQATGS